MRITKSRFMVLVDNPTHFWATTHDQMPDAGSAMQEYLAIQGYRAEELAVRAALRAQIAAGDSARDTEVMSLIERMLKVQRARVELLETEQQELASFLSPMQRAKYLGLEEQMRQIGRAHV